MEYFVGTPRIFDSELKHKNKKIKKKFKIMDICISFFMDVLHLNQSVSSDQLVVIS